MYNPNLEGTNVNSNFDHILRVLTSHILVVTLIHPDSLTAIH